ncbi:hypothetical protein EZS27_030215 [termite gut metagenome]|uniref:Uncharacterized protein n=1 Tax=termite gut metagenome TaxID=433724 RepID=A0A5J4QGB8_9ZZZZ
MTGTLIMCELLIAIALGAFIFAHTKAGKRFFDIKD